MLRNILHVEYPRMVINHWVIINQLLRMEVDMTTEMLLRMIRSLSSFSSDINSITIIWANFKATAMLTTQ